MTLKIIFDDAASLITGLNSDLVDFTFSVLNVSPKISHVSFSGETTILDWSASYDIISSQSMITYTVSPTTHNPIEIILTDPTVAQVDQTGLITFLKTEALTVMLRDQDTGSKSTTLIGSVKPSNFSLDAVTYKDPNSLGANVIRTMDNLFQNVDPTMFNDKYFRLWTTDTQNSQTVAINVKNPDRIAPELDLSWIAVVRFDPDWTNPTPFFPGHLISSRHVVIANHVQYGIGQHIRFVTKTGQARDAAVLQYSWIADDLGIVYLDTDILDIDPVCFPSESLSHYSLIHDSMFELDRNIQLSSGYSYSELPLNVNFNCPVLSAPLNPIPTTFVWTGGGSPTSPNPNASFTHWIRHLIVTNLYGLSKNNGIEKTGYPSGASCSIGPPTNNYKNYTLDIYPGDSSSPVFMPVAINGEIKCLLLTSYRGVFDGPNYSEHLADMVDCMNKQAAAHGDTKTYSLNTIDLAAAGFTRTS